MPPVPTPLPARPPDPAPPPDARGPALRDAEHRRTLRLRLRTRAFWIPLVLLLAITLPHLGQGGFRTDTGRYAAVGLQAWDRLLDHHDPQGFWSLSRQPDNPYWNKPPLTFWIHGLALRLADDLGLATPSGPHALLVARLPTVLAAAIVLLATIAAVRAFHGPGVAVTVGLVLATSYGFFNRVREISLDMWQAALLTAALALAAHAARRNSARLTILIGLPIGLALLVKPFMALLTLPILAAWLAIAGPRRLIPWLAGSLLLAALVAAPWHTAMLLAHGQAFTDQYLGREVIARAQGLLNSEPWWYYLRELATKYWPWLALLPPALWLMRTKPARRPAGLILALLWAAVWLVLLSAFSDKRPRYLLMAFPAFAWLAGWALSTLTPARLRRRNSRTIEWLPVALAAVAIAFAMLLPAPAVRRLHRGEGPEWPAVFAALDSIDPPPTLAFDRLGDNEQARWYLRHRVWPAAVGTPSLPTRDAVPPGTLILDQFQRLDDARAIPPGERLVWLYPEPSSTDPPALEGFLRLTERLPDHISPDLN